MTAVASGTIGVDVEDWFHPELVRSSVPAGDPRTVVERGTDALLEVFARHVVHATFFLLGEVARRHPALVRRIAAGGHEIACHGMTHRPLWALDRESFRAELRAFRAVLREEGFRYDSSIFPARSTLYGVPGAPLGIYRPATADLSRHDPAGPIVEFPVAIAALGPLRVPAAGGFYLRALPWGALRFLLDRVARERPFAIYLHPWEYVPGLPRARLGPAAALITYMNLDSVPGKLERLLQRYHFVPMRDVLEAGGHLSPAPFVEARP